MSVLITSMEMPKNCDECRFHVDKWCYVLRPESEEERKRITTNYCPLIEVPEREMFAVKDGVLYKADVKIPQGKVVKIPVIEVSDTEEEE